MHLLPRGYHISAENRIKKQIAGRNDCQIYLTNVDTYVLALTQGLYERWIAECSLPEGIFAYDSAVGLWIYQSSGDYIVSSLDNGPYPNNNHQIEAFSIAFKTAKRLYGGMDLHDAVYIEEYSLILPVSMEGNVCEDDAVYGRWIAGGVNISIDSFDRISQLMSWLPKDSLRKCATLAGFDVPVSQEENYDAKNDQSSNVTSSISDNTEVSKAIMPENGFRLIGRPELERFFNENIIDIIFKKERYQRMGISFPGATILYGPPGCGKTYAVEKLAEFLGWKRFDVDSSTIASSYIHDTSKKISEVFHSAITAAPSILVIDEMEAFLSNRNTSGSSGMYHVEEVAEFLRRIPEAVSKGVIVFAMTNMLDTIDPAILRRGRFDHIIEVKMTTSEEIEELLIEKFKELPVDENIDVKAVANELAGHPMSDIAFVIREAGRLAVKGNMDVISKGCFVGALGLLPKKKEHPKIGFGN